MKGCEPAEGTYVAIVTVGIHTKKASKYPAADYKKGDTTKNASPKGS